MGELTDHLRSRDDHLLYDFGESRITFESPSDPGVLFLDTGTLFAAWGARSPRQVTVDCRDIASLLALLAEGFGESVVSVVGWDRSAGDLIVNGVRAPGWARFANVRGLDAGSAGSSGICDLEEHYFASSDSSCFDACYEFLPAGRTLAFTGMGEVASGVDEPSYREMLLSPFFSQSDIRPTSYRVAGAWDEPSPPDLVPSWRARISAAVPLGPTPPGPLGGAALGQALALWAPGTQFVHRASRAGVDYFDGTMKIEGNEAPLDFEVQVVDFGATDQLEAIWNAHFSPRRRALRHQRSIGKTLAAVSVGTSVASVLVGSTLVVVLPVAPLPPGRGWRGAGGLVARAFLRGAAEGR